MSEGSGGTASWRPRHTLVSEIFHHPGDAAGQLEGANDCFEASLARYLREMGYPFSGDDSALVEAIRLGTTGVPDQAGQGFTWFAQINAELSALGIGYRFTSSAEEALNATWAILWVHAGSCRLAQPVMVDGLPRWTAYPPEWVASEPNGPDHFILKLPDSRVNDPLAYWTGDCVYSRTSLLAACGGGYILESPPSAAVNPNEPASKPVSHPPVTAPAASGAGELVVVATSGLHLREEPAANGAILVTLHEKEHVADAYGACPWRFVHARGLYGWVRREFVTEETAHA